MEDRGKFKGIDEWSEFNGLSFTAGKEKFCLEKLYSKKWKI